MSAHAASARATLLQAVLAQETPNDPASTQTPADPASTPLPTSPEHFTIYNVTPGIEGFLLFFVLAVAALLLGRALVRRLRRVDSGAQSRGLPRTGPQYRDAAGMAARPEGATSPAEPSSPEPSGSEASGAEISAQRASVQETSTQRVSVQEVSAPRDGSADAADDARFRPPSD